MINAPLQLKFTTSACAVPPDNSVPATAAAMAVLLMDDGFIVSS
jgi:hypothetical protein